MSGVDGRLTPQATMLVVAGAQPALQRLPHSWPRSGHAPGLQGQELRRSHDPELAAIEGGKLQPDYPQQPTHPRPLPTAAVTRPFKVAGPAASQGSQEASLHMPDHPDAQPPAPGQPCPELRPVDGRVDVVPGAPHRARQRRPDVSSVTRCDQCKDSLQASGQVEPVLPGDAQAANAVVRGQRRQPRVRVATQLDQAAAAVQPFDAHRTWRSARA
mmetsp:Transcript_73563/g.239463  ORF Transcript_73563/g.239463 Transcript_73563/m.239463 type:complete len:215 (-) Transcript_73563:313-957(-)